jgi:hypothetical protein
VTYLGDTLVALDAANPDASPIRQAYRRWWETPRTERPHPALARLAAILIRIANRLAPATPDEHARPATHPPPAAAHAAGEP